ncbi:MAG TPA: lysophospholipid acyltransferase family protein [Chloroflexia bacterium]|jgi:1-acyl-sn-glycerol-3-phosphate acyltransferase
MSSREKKLSYEWQPSRGWYVVIRAFFTVVFHTIWPLRVSGRENVPRKGAAIIVCNHLSLVDPFVVGYAANRIVNFMGKEELFGVPIVGFLIRKVGAFPVDRSRRDPAAMRTALQVLKSGELLGMFPEGTRSTTGEMLEFRAGAARLAARTEVPIIPAAVHNTGKAMPPGKLLRPARISIRFGEPFDLAELYDRRDKGEAMDRALQTIKERIEALAEP